MHERPATGAQTGARILLTFALTLFFLLMLSTFQNNMPKAG